MTDPSADVTRLLRAWADGDRDALDQLVPLVYPELRAIASRRLASARGRAVLQTTALVNEAYLRLLGQREVDWQNRGHFLAIAAQLMRRILVDHARRELSAKRGSGHRPLSLDDFAPVATFATDVVDALDLDRALRKLEQLDPLQGSLVELRFFGGLTLEETAVVLGVSPSTVKREWVIAKGWLHRELARGPAQA